MKKRNKVFSGIFLFIIILAVLFIFRIGKMNVGLFIDKLGLTKNSFQFIVDDKISYEDLFIYWFGETDYTKGEEFNKILIYHRKFQSDILDSYGKNVFLIKYKDTDCKRVGILKLHAYSKHNYKIDLKLDGENLIIDWSIKNWYETDIYQGSDTVRIN
jgi:hypothetical protein